MDVIRFIDIIQSYGADPARWPEAERDAAQNFASKFEDARTLLSEARQLDSLLSRAAAPAPSAALRAKILSQARSETPALTHMKPANDRLPYRAIAASLIGGLMIGWVSGFGSGGDVTPAQGFDYAQTEDDSLFDYDWMDETFEDGKF